MARAEATTFPSDKDIDLLIDDIMADQGTDDLLLDSLDDDEEYDPYPEPDSDGLWDEDDDDDDDIDYYGDWDDDDEDSDFDRPFRDSEAW
jgi:hypothetical protein